LTLFQSGLGCLNCSQTRLPAFDLGRDVQIRLILLGLVRIGSLLNQRGDLRFELNFG
jgi:hypothetical protein